MPYTRLIGFSRQTGFWLTFVPLPSIAVWELFTKGGWSISATCVSDLKTTMPQTVPYVRSWRKGCSKLSGDQSSVAGVSWIR